MLIADKLVAALTAWLAADPALTDLVPKPRDTTETLPLPCLLVAAGDAVPAIEGCPNEPIWRVPLQLRLHANSEDTSSETFKGLAKSAADRFLLFDSEEAKSIHDSNDVVLSALLTVAHRWDGEGEGDVWQCSLEADAIAG